MISVNSEIGQLKKVIVHRPDDGISRISPKRAEELLFDDIVYLPEMREEHETFVQVLNAFLGAENVLETEDLIFEGLEADPALRLELIEKAVDYEELPSRDINTLSKMDNKTLTKVLITGYFSETDRIFFDPIPNFIFTRDIAVAVKDHIIITKAAKEARFRENLLTRFIFLAHPMFAKLKKEGKIINLNNIDLFPPSRYREPVSIEGGDMMMLADDFLLIGCSERTTNHAITSITKVVFEKELVNNVVQINIPDDRSCMHIDTLFTKINYKDVVCFKPTVYDGIGSDVVVRRRKGAEVKYNSIREFFLGEIDTEMQFIFSGNGLSPYQEREQWTDGCNLVALKPGVGITYDRNHRTEIAFREAGYEIISATELLKKIDNGDLHPDEIESTIITLKSSELSRARGGSHCMTCPIDRTFI